MKIRYPSAVEWQQLGSSVRALSVEGREGALVVGDVVAFIDGSWEVNPSPPYQETHGFRFGEEGRIEPMIAVTAIAGFRLDLPEWVSEDQAASWTFWLSQDWNSQMFKVATLGLSSPGEGWVQLTPEIMESAGAKCLAGERRDLVYTLSDGRYAV